MDNQKDQKLPKPHRKRTYLLIILAVSLFILGSIGAILGIRMLGSASNNPQIDKIIISPTPVPVYLESLAGSNAIVTRNNLKLNPESPLAQGDIITTGEQSIAVIHFDPDNESRLGPNTKVQLTSSGPSLKLFQNSGSIFVRFTKILGKHEDFTVETPTSLATVRGTKFAVFTNIQSTKVFALDHKIETYKIHSLNKKVLPET